MSTQFTLSDLLNQVDIEGFFERQGVAIARKPTNSRDGREVHGSCPKCGGHDRFAFWPERGGRYSCSLRSSGCGIHGSNAYWYGRDVLGMTHHEILEELGIDPSSLSFNGDQKVKLPLFLLTDEIPVQKWQDAAGGFCRACEHVLWSSKGESARTYLHSRGFTDDTIRTGRLGLNPDWYKAPLDDWGLSPEQLGKEDDPQIKVPRGIVIPWYVDSSIHKIQLRRPEGGYVQVKGSCDCLYNSDTLQVGQPACVFESEFDALSAYQEASDIIGCIATGGTSKGLNARNVARLARAGVILQSFDADEPGNKGAETWLAKYAKEKARRWAPWSHDCNYMLKTGLPVRAWIEAGLQTFETHVEASPPALPILTEEEHAQLLIDELKAIGGYLRFDHELQSWAIGCPDSMSEEQYKEVKARVLALDEPLHAIIDKQHFCKLGKLVPPELVDRVAAFQSGKKICCDSLDWMIDPNDGLIICPCVQRLREENKQLDERLEREEAIKRQRWAA